MAAETDEGTKRSALVLIAAVVLALLAARPFLPYQGAPPLQRDSLTWIENTAPDAEERWDWSLRQSHFIGYRPLTALTFAVGADTHGDDATALRAFDLALHVLTCVVLFLLAASLFGVGPAFAAGLFFAVHPASDEVVPFLARRSYSLSTLLALCGLWCARRRGIVTGVLAGPLLLAAMFAHELGAVVALALPAVVLARATSPGRRLGVCAWSAACLAVGVWIRSGVMEGVDGYAIGDDFAERARAVLGAFGSSIGGRLSVEGTVWFVVLGACAAYYVAQSVRLAIARRFAALLILLALVAYGVIVAREAVWFPRQAYGAAALVGLLVAAVQSESSKWHAVAPLTLIAVGLVHSPAIHGSNPDRVARARAATAFVDGVREAARGLGEPGNIGIVARIELEEESDALTILPDRTGGRERQQRHMRMPFIWLKRTLGADDVILRELAYVVGPDSEAELVLEPAAQVTLGEGTVAYEGKRAKVSRMHDTQRVIRIRRVKKDVGRQVVWSNLRSGEAPELMDL